MRPKPWSSCSGRNGFTVVPDGQPADVYIVNSCTVTNFGDQKSRKWLRHAKRENPGAVTVLTGCYPQGVSPSRLPACWKRTWSAATPTARAILDHVDAAAERPMSGSWPSPPHTRGEAFEEIAGGPVRDPHPRLYQGGGRLQPPVRLLHHPPRPGARCAGRPISSILAELRQLAGAGYREVVLSAISLPQLRHRHRHPTSTSWWSSAPGWQGIQRIRLGSLGPPICSRPEGIRRLAAVDKLCPQFHPQFAERLRCHAAPDAPGPTPPPSIWTSSGSCGRPYAGRPVSFTTDCICGFPGESEEDFVRSCGFLEEVGFLRVHVFPYSRREGTPGLRFPPAGPRAGKQARSRRMHDRAEEVRRAVLAGLEGSVGPGAAGDPPVSATVFNRLYPAVCAGQRVGAGLCRRGYRAGCGWAATTDGAPGSRRSSWAGSKARRLHPLDSLFS